MNKKIKLAKGFTLIELIVVIAVLAILAAVLLPRFLGFTDSARSSDVRSDAKNIATAVEAMIAEDRTISASDVMEYVGKELGGELTINTTTTDTDYGDFMYVEQLPSSGGKYYGIGYDYNDSIFVEYSATGSDVQFDETYTNIDAPSTDVDVTLPGTYSPTTY